MTDRDKGGERRPDGGFGDDQSTRVGSPDVGEPSEPQHDREERATGAGTEPLGGESRPDRTHEHTSGYGGQKSEPRTSSDTRPGK